jgi:hypothetical protein
MEKIENFNVSFGDNIPEKPVHIYLYEGQAPQPERTLNPQKLKVVCDLNGVVDFVKDRYTSGKKDIAGVVTYSDSPADIYVELQTNPVSEIQTVIKGVLKSNPDLREFHFNEKGAFNNKSFIDVIRKNAHCFASIEEAKRLVKLLTNFQASFTTEVEDLDNRQGTTKNSVETVLNVQKGKIPETVTFKMPLFDGGDPVEFSVDVEIDVKMKDNKPEAMFGFFSMDFVVLQRDEAKDYVGKTISVLSDYFTCMRVV